MDPLVPHAAPHVTPPATPDPSAKKRNLLIIIGVIIVGFILFTGLIISCVFSIGGPVMKSGELFLTQLSSGQVDQAYESAAIQFKQTVSKEVFDSFLKEYPISTKVKSVSFNSFNVENNIYANLNGFVTGTDGQVSPVSMRLVSENNAWRVLYIDFLTPEEKAKANAMQQQAQQQASQGTQQGDQQAATQGDKQPVPPTKPQAVTGEAKTK